MKAVIVYESESGTFKLLAQAIEMGLGERMHTELLNVHDAAGFTIGHTDLLVVGAPTHDAPKPGVREWLTTLDLDQTWCASFSARATSLLPLGSAAAAILRALRRAGGVKLAPPVAFLIERTGSLASNELRYAQVWGRQLGAAMEGAPGVPVLARPRT